MKNSITKMAQVKIKINYYEKTKATNSNRVGSCRSW